MVVLVASIALALWDASSAKALDAFEIQVYDGSANAPGAAGIELHLNSVVAGQRQAVAPELPPDHQTHLTAEPSLGITRWWELGGYLQTTILPDGRFDYSGVKLRSKFVRPGGESDRLRWGLNLEVSDLPPSYDRDRWGAEVRPIVAYGTRGGPFVCAFNPILDFGLAGPSASAIPSFEPALTTLVVFDGLLSAGLEYYADVGQIGRFLPARAQQHYLFEVVNVLHWTRIEINAGVGEGLTSSSNHFVAKMILGFQ
jgi:hypothetical protein